MPQQRTKQSGGSVTAASIPLALMVLKSMVDKYIRNSGKPKAAPALPRRSPSAKASLAKASLRPNKRPKTPAKKKRTAATAINV